ncbi:hypothetical protein AcV7_001735 [Taiwanofungus camphoratus]|nr:hypothetical protein AcV7_001735 [Antrodia cinnamomea]
MLVDNPLQSSFSLNSAFEDFFNMDLLAGPSNTATASGGSSPRSSPSNTYSTLPPTPPNPFLPDMTSGANPYLNFSLDDEFAKLDHFAEPLAAPGFDFLSAFMGVGANQISSPESASGSGGSSSVGDSPVGIDPSLVGTPAQSKPMSEFGDADEENEEEEEAEHEDSPSIADTLDMEQEMCITPVKVGGRGNAGRKGTVQSGGVVKRAGSEKKENKPAGMLSTTSTEADDWRPSPEEYKKMSSKEKRQLRNKISARNFRVRRKEYISTLEGDIAERDRLIDAIRNELGSTKSENIALRQEIAALKKALLEGRGRADTPVLPPPAPLPSIPASLLASGPSSNGVSNLPVPPKSPLLTPNTQKDLPTSPRLGARGFWGGASGSGLGGFGGITPVHTTLVPEWGSILSGKPLAGVKSAPGRRSPALQENINPILNLSTAQDKLREQQQQQQQHVPSGALESFMDMNPFSMKTIDPYRMQLWRNMAAQQRQHHASQQQQSSPSPGSSHSPSGLANGLRPHYFTKQGPTLSALLSGKTAAASYPTPPNSPPLLPSLTSSSAHNIASNQKNQPMPTQQQAMLASMASQTLVRKLGSAFWDAFAVRPSSSAAASAATGGGRQAPQWDAEKVRRVIEGSAVVRVVDVEPQQQTVHRITSPLTSPRLSPAQSQAVEKEKRACHITDLLEESMRSLSLGKK